MPVYSINQMKDLAVQLDRVGFSYEELEVLARDSFRSPRGEMLLRALRMCVRGEAKIVSPHIESIPVLASIMLGTPKDARACRVLLESIKCELNEAAEAAIDGAAYATEEVTIDCVAVSLEDLGFGPDQYADPQAITAQATGFGLLICPIQGVPTLVSKLYEQDHKEILRVLDGTPSNQSQSFVFNARHSKPFLKSVRGTMGTNYSKTRSVFIRPR